MLMDARLVRECMLPTTALFGGGVKLITSESNWLVG